MLYIVSHRFMIKLQVHNDGKEKWQSYDARLDESESNIYLNGYGQNKEEAVSELKTRVEDKIKELQNIDWNNFYWIAWDGEVLQNGV